MAAELDIWNLALQKLGVERLSSTTQNHRNARSCAACYETTRDAELEKYRWTFAIARVVLAPDASAPAFGFTYRFPVPSDCLRVLLPPDTELDWVIENGYVLTNYGDTLEIRYVARVTDTSRFSPTFVKALAMKMAEDMCEELTQSNQKKADAQQAYKDAIAEARRTNAIEKISADPPEDPWLYARR